jgi:hypothetical protein
LSSLTREFGHRIRPSVDRSFSLLPEDLVLQPDGIEADLGTRQSGI